MGEVGICQQLIGLACIRPASHLAMLPDQTNNCLQTSSSGSPRCIIPLVGGSLEWRDVIWGHGGWFHHTAEPSLPSLVEVAVDSLAWFLPEQHRQIDCVGAITVGC